MLWLFAAALGIGILIGTVGIGGILLIPALSALAGFTLHEAMATALFTFVFTGSAGTIAFQRRGSIDWTLTVPVCLGAAPFAFAGAWLNSRATADLLGSLLAAIIIFAGIYALANWRGAGEPALHGRPAAQRGLLVAVGAIVGLGAGLAGVGGPVLSVPLMVLAGFPVLASIGTGQVIQIVAASAGTLGNLQFGAIGLELGLALAALEIVGVLAGARLAHAMSPLPLRRLVALLCIGVGAFLLGQLPAAA